MKRTNMLRPVSAALLTVTGLGLLLARASITHAAAAAGAASQSSSMVDDILRAIAQVPPYGWHVLLSASIVGSAAYVGAILNQMRRDQRQSFEFSERREFEALMKTRERDVADLLGSEEGWRTLIGQVAADVTATGVVVDDAGVLNATIKPTPYFTVRAADGRDFYFTVDAKKLQASKVIPPGSRVLDVSRRGSLTSPIDLHLFWTRLTEQRRMSSLSLPRNARWFCVVKHPEVWDASGAKLRSAHSTAGKR